LGGASKCFEARLKKKGTCKKIYPKKCKEKKKEKEREELEKKLTLSRKARKGPSDKVTFRLSHFHKECNN
jgi:hypothetical protein